MNGFKMVVCASMWIVVGLVVCIAFAISRDTDVLAMLAFPALVSVFMSRD